MVTNIRSLVRMLAAVATAALMLLLGAAVPAHAHTELRASTPEEGATVDFISELRLEFTDEILTIGAELTLVDANGAEYELAPQFPSVNAITGRLDDTLPAGPAQLHWRIVAEDGHPMEGVLSFTSAPSGEQAEPAPTATAATDPGATEDPDPEPVASPSATPEPAPSVSPTPAPAETGGIAGWVLPVVGLAVVGTAIAAVMTLRARRE